MPCNDCPELIPNPNEGCLQPITSECVTYNGEDVICATITSGQNLNQVIEQLATNDCDLQEQIEDVISSLETFTCEDLSGCSINDLADVDVTPVSGESLVFNGTNWISQTIVLPNEFSCESLSGCSLDDFSNVIETSSASGDVLIFNGTNWVNVEYDLLLTANNGLTKSSSNIELGGTLIKNTSILGANFDLVLGTNASSIDKLNAYTDSVNIRSTLFSFNESDENTQTKGFRFETNKTSIAIGTDVFDNFNIEDCFRIGNNISISDTSILPNTTPKGTYIGKNINSVNSGIGPIGYGVAIGEDISLDFFIGTAIGKDISIDNAIGGFLLGTNINISGFGLGDQSTYVFGNKVDITYSINLPQSTLVFNPSNQDIKSSSTGLAIQEKIKTNDSDNRIITVFNSDEYYFFTNIANDDGWAINSDLFKVTQNYIRVPKSNGTILDEEEGCIRFNTSTSRYQGYVGGVWVDFH